MRESSVTVLPSDREGFALQISACWRKSFDSIIEVGQLLSIAKNKLPHGDFGAMIQADLPFGARTAQMLMKIAADPRITNARHASLLPPNYSDLYDLTKLSDEQFEARVEDGTIRPDMGRNAIRSEVKQNVRAAREQSLGAKEPKIPISELSSDWPRYYGDEALRVGRAAEHLVCADGLMRGWNAFLAGQGTPYDVVFEKDAKLVRVQVKAAQHPRNVNSTGKNPRIAYSFAALRRGRNGEGPRLTRNEADLFACVALDVGVIAYLPVADCSSTIQLECDDIVENGYKRNYERQIREYPLDRAIARLDAEPHYLQLKQQFAAFPKRAFRLIYADPPWSFATWSDRGMDRSADNHYPTISTDLLCGIGPYVPAADDAVLFLWATSPMLPDAVRVMGMWGFDYKTSFVWKKNRAGSGYWFRNQHETLLLGMRGNVPAPAHGTQENSIIEAPLAKHSEKPNIFYEVIERMFPSFSKLEMFCRGPARPGWDVWGNEAEQTTESAVSSPAPEPASEQAPQAPDAGSPLSDDLDIPDFSQDFLRAGE